MVRKRTKKGKKEEFLRLTAIDFSRAEVLRFRVLIYTSYTTINVVRICSIFQFRPAMYLIEELSWFYWRLEPSHKY